MAEARLAVAVQFQVTDEGLHLNIDRDALKFVWRALVKRAKLRLSEARKSVLKRSFPATPVSWLFLVATLSAARYTEHKPTVGVLGKLERVLPGARSLDPATLVVIAVLLTATLLWFIVGHLLQFTLRQLLKYRRFLYEPRGKISMQTKCWLGLVKLLGGKNPLLYSYEKSLPYLPVPDLDNTMSRYLESVRPILGEEKFREMEKLATEFKSGMGPKLQRYLVLKSWWSNNYVSDWWEQFVYLRSRAPIMINSNYYGVDAVHQPTNIQSARAGNVIHAMFLYRTVIEKEDLEPQFAMGIIPLCSEQFRRNFNTTRIPGKEQDTLMHFHSSSHVVVYHQGRFFKLDCFYRGNLLKPADLERQIQKILDDKTPPLAGEELLPAITAGERTVWADARSTYFSKGVNQDSLDCIEKAAFFLSLSDLDMDYAKESSDKLDAFGKYAMHGNGHSCWFDKSFSVYVFRNGRIGFNAEHSWADAPIVSHLGEWTLTDDACFLGYKEDGHCKGNPDYDLPAPKKLEWDIPSKCLEIIDDCQAKAEILIKSLDLHIYVHTDFGKGFIKTCRVSPDGFIQMALQLAWFKDQGNSCLTYESAMTRLFREGRTETVRPCSMDSVAFVKAILDPSTPKSTKKSLFVKAVDKHVNTFRKAMSGEGVDRHMFCLYVVSRHLEEDSPFLKEALSMQWKLSTSQTATQQTKRVNVSENPAATTAGGGFGPVADDGYGVSYIVSGEDLVFFHITCKNTGKTDAKRFAKNIRESMATIKTLFE